MLAKRLIKGVVLLEVTGVLGAYGLLFFLFITRCTQVMVTFTFDIEMTFAMYTDDLGLCTPLLCNKMFIYFYFRNSMNNILGTGCRQFKTYKLEESFQFQTAQQ